MNRRLREGLGWLFLASLLLLAVVWGIRIGTGVDPAIGIKLYVAAPGGGLRVVETEIPKAQLDAFALWARLQEVSQSSKATLLPAEAKLLEVRQEDTVLVASFSIDLIRKRYLGSNEETALVYSIVNTLAQLPEIESVQIMIEGVMVEALADHVDLTAPLLPDTGLVVD